MDSPVRRQKRVQSASRKFPRFTGSLWAGTLNLGGVMREGRYCEWGNFPRTPLSGIRLSWPKLAKARSGLVPTLQRRDKKLAVSFGLYNSTRLLDLAEESGLSPSGDVVTPADMPAVKVANIQSGVWERRACRWCDSRAWRFVDVDDLVSCDVYAQPFSLCYGD